MGGPNHVDSIEVSDGEEDGPDIASDAELQDDFIVYQAGYQVWRSGRNFPSVNFENKGIAMRPEHPGEELPAPDGA